MSEPLKMICVRFSCFHPLWPGFFYFGLVVASLMRFCLLPEWFGVSPPPPNPHRQVKAPVGLPPAPRWPPAPGVVMGVGGAGPGVHSAQIGDAWSSVSHSLTHCVALRESDSLSVSASVKWAEGQPS